MQKKARLERKGLIRLNPQSLQDLIDQGFRYVQIRGLSIDNRLDYMEPSYLILLPIKELPHNPELKGIYEPIDSAILTNWSNSPNDGIEVFVATNH